MAGPNKFYEEISRECMKDFRFIGRGAFGVIYRARHQDWGIDVAVKILSRKASFTWEELLKEARAMDKARFLYVLRLFGLFVDKLQPDSPVVGLVMEYMENGSLSTLLDWDIFIPWALRFRILYEVALGMNFLHSLRPPLLHLDLKLSNILLDADLHAKVADFGLSKFKRGTTWSTGQASEEGDGYGGTLEYLPPEAFADFNYRPTPSADVYSYGILMWSLLAGQEPYSNVPPGNLSFLIRRLIPQGQRPSTEALEKIDDVCKMQDVISLMKRCWSNDKVQRPSFKDCSSEMEGVYSCHQPQIIAAVREVQDVLLQKKTSPSKETWFSSGSGSAKASPAPLRVEKVECQQLVTTSSAFEECFDTLRLEELPSRQNEAAPPQTVSAANQQGRLSAPMPLQRSHSAFGGKEAEERSDEEPHQSEVKFRPKPPDGRPRRPYSDTYVFPPFPPYHPGSVPYPQDYYRPQQQGDFGSASLAHSLLPQFGHGAPREYLPEKQDGGIHIYGHGISGVQFGDHTTMHIVQSHERKPRKK